MLSTLWWSAGVGPAEAQSDCAERFFQQGVNALDAFRFGEARDFLRRSLECDANSGTAFNLAVAYRGTGEMTKARALYVRLLESEFGSLSRAERGEIRQLLRDTEAAIATLEVTIDGPEEAEVRVDGERVAMVPANEPHRQELDPGTHRLALVAPGFIPEELRIDLEPGEERAMDFELVEDPEARLATLLLEADDPDATIEIVGHGTGIGRLERELEPGTYQVRISNESASRESTVELEPGVDLRVQLELPSGSGVLASPFFWIGTAVVVAGLVVGGVFLFGGGSTQDPVEDEFFGVIETLGASP